MSLGEGAPPIIKRIYSIMTWVYGHSKNSYLV